MCNENKRTTPLLALLVLLQVMTCSAYSFDEPKATVYAYPVPSGVYDRSEQFSLIANDTEVPVVKDRNFGYDYAHFSMSDGSCSMAIKSSEEIVSFSISPLKLGIAARNDGRVLRFTLSKDAYLIVNINGKKLVIAADPKEKEIPRAKGKGIFNLKNYIKKPATPDQVASTTKSIQQAIDDASQYGTTHQTQGIVYIPQGLYYAGNLVLKSNIALYFEGGSVLRSTGKPEDYTVKFRKNSQNRNGTWWIYTEDKADNIKLYGRGTLDGNGYFMAHTNNFGNHILVPLNCSRFTLDGLLIRDSGSWSFVVARSNDVVVKNYKHFNSLSAGENDGIDVCESQNVLVQHSIGIGLDDPYSTKTWETSTDISRSWYGQPEPLDNVTFDDCFSWSICVGFKLGQGSFQPQSNVTFKNSVVYNCDRGIALQHKYGTATYRKVLFENIDIERVTSKTYEGPRWFQCIVENGFKDGGGPIHDVTIRNITVRDRGARASVLKGLSENASISGIRFENIMMPDSTAPAKSLEEMNITDVGFYSDVVILPR
jgi:polygalacturonase